MILDKEKVSELLANNKGEDKMEYESKSNNNTYLMPSNRDDEFWKLLFAYGLVDRNGNKTGSNATSEQVAHLATTMGITSAEVTGKLDRIQIATCEQTHAITGAIHTASTVNAVGQNALGEKVTGNGFRIESNAKDIEKTVLVDGGLTRKNDDGNSSRNLTAQTVGFNNVEKSLCGLDSKMSSQHCDIKGEIKDTKYELANLMKEEGNLTRTQATHNYNDLLSNITAGRNEALVIDKNNEIRRQDTEIANLKEAAAIARYTQTQKDIEELKHCKDKDAEINILSKNIGSAIGNSINSRFDRFEDCVERRIAIGNNISLGGNAGNKG